MEFDLLIILIALSAALAILGLSRAAISMLGSEKSKLSERLASEWRTETGSVLARPIVIQLEVKGLPLWLARKPFIQKLNRKLVQAYPEASLRRFIGISVFLALLMYLLVLAITASLLPAGLSGIAAGYVPFMVLNSKRSRRQKTLANQLPEALDFLSRVLRAGHSLSTGIQMLGDEMREPIGSEFRRCYDQHSLGVSLDHALREMASKIESSDFAFFVTATLIQRQTGGDLAEVLNNIATTVRNRVRLQNHMKAITAEGRLTGYILVAFPAVLFVVTYVMNPTYAGVLLNTEKGQMLLGGSVVLQALGLVAIRKIIAVKG